MFFVCPSYVYLVCLGIISDTGDYRLHVCLIYLRYTCISCRPQYAMYLLNMLMWSLLTSAVCGFLSGYCHVCAT